jgi:predicted DCC family thiol-disulfide oxidoreductase YuxK
MSTPEASPSTLLLYDGECPVCSFYVRYNRLAESVGKLDLIDARARPDLVADYRARGYEINDGMILDMNGTVHFGDRAMVALAAITSPSQTFNRLNAALFRSPRLAAGIYPILAVGRRMLLKLLGRRKIG